MTNSLFEKAKPIIQTLQIHGFQAYFVGGSVRDYLMNKSIHDIDITTSATPDEIESIFEKTIPIGREHGTINVVYQHDQYEVTTFRAEGEYDDHRRPNEVYFVRDLYEDVKRRDFTMNAIAMDDNYQIHDYFDGQNDISHKIIRTVGQPDERFNEDALRIIRGLRFQSQLGFQLEPHTYKAMLTHIADIKHLSIERVVVELEKLIAGNYVDEAFITLKQLKAFEHIPFFRDYDLDSFSIDIPMTFTLFIAMLKVQQPDVDAKITALKISNRDKKEVVTLEQLINDSKQIYTKAQLKLFVYDYGKKDILNMLSYTQTLAENNIAQLSPLILNEIAISNIADQLPISSRGEMDINGKDILEITNKKSGPWLKDTLRAIECAIIAGDVQNLKPDLIKWVKAHVQI
ncbi:CCA tRNA nucleotidyltransferase [Staphylococcus caeli]|uniref:CCA-adding enzyme n=1 Tax=Staphylococcus caeli TaxID=2201815 RepID=A0A1D4P1Z5_9STAP|nr:CCA tRNA nucleotidyltransferase [Staphylococcus caeli]SCT04555.1 tRNA CCA-pyrophosphorylase [Staphylococcus caeli]SCT16948.1 tRNA CCA-pyrophosphorylase [Staphylococcus caeli]